LLTRLKAAATTSGGAVNTRAAEAATGTGYRMEKIRIIAVAAVIAVAQAREPTEPATAAGVSLS
jgi:hypothetical protein